MEAKKNNMTADEIKSLSKGILSEVHEFCENNELRYFLAYGTLLGAIRHKGFIPWDDDIDIFMPRPDYEKFILEYKSTENYIYGIKTKSSRYYAIPYSKVCSNKTYGTDLNGNMLPYGVGIDVFPLDGLPNDEKKALNFFNKQYRLFHYGYVLSILCETTSNHGSFLRRMIIKILKYTWFFIFPSNYYVKKIDKMAKKYNFNSSEYCHCATSLYKKNFEKTPVTYYENSSLTVFEDKKFRIMKHPEYLLSVVYGSDYMVPPPEDKRQSTHEVLYYYM